MNALHSPAVWSLLLLALGACCVLLFGPQREGRSRRAGVISGITLLLVSTVWVLHFRDGHGALFSGMLVLEELGALAALACTLAALITVPGLNSWLQRSGRSSAEIHALLLLAVAGMQVMAQTRHLAVLFLGLETLSIALYALCACQRERTTALEAGFKYFLSGAFASALLLLGIALIFGLTGSFDVSAAAAALRGGELMQVACVLLVAGFGFKLSLVPFHQWAPDVYQGAPTPVTGFMATAVKVTGFVALLRLLPLLSGAGEGMLQLFAALAVVTMAVGNIAALAQQSVKRMLAYSSIAHAGYLLAGACAALCAPQSSAAGAVLFYLLLYTLMNLGAFGVLAMLESSEGGRLDFAHLAGMRQRRPLLAASLLVCLLSLAGVPLTGGFLAKWGVFAALVPLMDGAHGTLFTVLTVTLALTSLVGLAYYLRVVMAMYAEPTTESAALPAVPRLAAFAVLLLAAALLWIGCAPGPWGSEGLNALVRSACSAL